MRRRLLASTALPAAILLVLASAPETRAQEVIDGPPPVTKAGAEMIAGGLIVGQDLPGSELTIDGLALITVTGNTVVGQNAGSNGLITIQGGELNNGLGYIGGDFGGAGGIGAVTVTGANSYWVNSSAMYVGTSGQGTLRVEDGGTVRDTSGTIGANAGSIGTATVTGEDSTWTNSAEFYVGLLGDGTLNIEAGGTVSVATSAYIGRFANSTGVATVTGPGSTLTATAELHVGYSSNGTLTVSDGGAVSNATGYIGYANATTGSGAVTITGAGSTWTNTAALYVGEGNDGTLTISDSGLVQVAGGAGTITVGFDAGSSGEINIGAAAGDTAIGAGVLDAATIQFGDGTGSGVVFNHTDAAYGFDTAITGVGTVSHYGGVTILSSLLNDWTGDTNVHGGTLVIEGLDSHAGQTVNVGVDAADDGALTVRAGGDLSNADSFIAVNADSAGEATVTGVGSTWIHTGDLTVGSGGEGTLTIADGGLVSNDYAFIGDAAGASGGVTVTGDGSSWTTQEFIYVGMFGEGTLAIEAGGDVESGGSSIGVQAGSDGAATITGAGSTWVIDGTLAVGLRDEGSLSITDGGTVSSDLGYVGFDATGAGALTVAGTGSRWDTLTTTEVGHDGTGSLTIADEGVVSVAAGSGQLDVAVLVDSVGALNIGAAIGDTAAGAGVLDATTVQFGLGDGSLNFNHTDTAYQFDAVVTGDGAINVAAGTTALNADSSTFSGSTTITGGALLVEGVLGGTVAVASGGVLGGSGVIGDDVTVAGGGALAPGSSPGTLTIQGNLILSQTSILDFELDQAGIIGSGVNDLIEVNGDLTLDGVLDVSDAGAFGNGVYRLINYSGGITDNILEFGVLPSGVVEADLEIQVSVANQVNLINSATIDLLFWDGGTPADADNDLVDGGDGTWTATSETWTAADGATNGAMTPVPGFAVFMGVGGTVTADASAGALSVTGMQFAVDGYVLTGDPVALAEANPGDGAFIRVGDGTSTGEDWTATIASDLNGAVSLTKTDLGVLVLTGTNDWSGSTLVRDGELVIQGSGSISNNADLQVGVEAGDEALLTIIDGGSVSTGNGVIGVDLGSWGDVFVTGVGSTWTNTGGLTVGADGEGYLVIEDGGVVVSDGGVIGDGLDGFGEVVVSGAGSSWNSTSGVTVGNDGLGDLMLADGGSMSIDGGSGTLSIASGIDSFGVLEIGDPCLCSGRAAGVLYAARVVFGDGQGAVAFQHDEADYAFAPDIEGFGIIAVLSGRTTLTGNSSGFTGATVVAGLDPSDTPELVVEEMLGGDVAVFSGGALTGSGIILGDVAVDDGVLSNLAGDTLTMGSLSLGADSIVAVSLGAVGSPALFDVGGDLVLDGGLAVADAGGFGPGVYSLFGYGGALTDNGLDIDSVPTGNTADYSIQTSVSGEVNLVSDLDPGDLLFWDGADTGLHDNDIVNGGDGVWDAANSNWTNLSGAVNGAMNPQPGFAVFQGAGGTVTTDDSLGAINVTGMQFAVDGYVVQGDAIALVDADTMIRVGNGTAGGAVFTTTIDAELTGAGRLVKTDLGVLILTGANSYTGGVTVEDGVLVGDTGSLRGDIDNDGRVVFQQAFDATYADLWSGAGVFEKEGDGTLTLTGLSGGFAGETFINDGILVVNGALGGALTIGPDGRLEGVGALDVVLIADDAVVAPGNSIGTLTVNGDIIFAAGATYEVETDPVSGASDLIHATGTATINGGTVAHIGLAGAYRPFSTYTILTADAGVSGTFDTLDTAFAFLDPELTYDANNVFLTLVRNDITFAGVGETPNQIATGEGVESLGASGTLWNAIVTQSAVGARDAFDDLSGEIHPSTRGALIEDSSRLRQILMGQLHGDEAEGTHLWADAYGGSVKTDSDGNAASLDRDGAGLFVGADRRFGAWRLGVSGGTSEADVEARARDSSAETESHHLAVYGGGQLGALGLRFGAARSWHEVTVDRTIAFTGFSDAASAAYDAESTQVFIEAGWRRQAGPATFEPFANLAHLTLDADPFSEDGGPVALTSSAQKESVTFSTLGLRASRAFPRQGGASTSLHGSAGWRHATGDITSESRFTFGGTGDVFTIRGAPIAQDALAIDAGLDVELSDRMVVSVAYGGQIGDGVQDHVLRGHASWRF